MQRPFYKSFLANFIYICIIGLILYWLFFSSLGWLTGHAKEVQLPDLKGKSWTDVAKILKQADFEVDVDSAYNPEVKPLTVLDQQPEAGSMVKEGRTIFLTINKMSPPEVPMPHLVNLSYRSAEMLLKSNKLLLGDTTMKPDLAQGAVLAQLIGGQEIASGKLIPQGTRIDLVIGDGYGNKEIKVPDLTGLSYPEAVAMISGSNLQFTVIFDGNITDSLAARVYVQEPQPYNEFQEPNQILEGEFIDFRVREGGMEPQQVP